MIPSALHERRPRRNRGARHTPTARLPYLFEQVRHAPEGGQHLISLGSQPVIVLIDARDLRLERIQAPEFGPQPLVLLGPFGQQTVGLLVIEAEEPTDLRDQVLDILGALWGAHLRSLPSLRRLPQHRD